MTTRCERCHNLTTSTNHASDCQYCFELVPCAEMPQTDDEWIASAAYHLNDCEWIATRAFTLDARPDPEIKYLPSRNTCTGQLMALRVIEEYGVRRALNNADYPSVCQTSQVYDTPEAALADAARQWGTKSQRRMYGANYR